MSAKKNPWKQESTCKFCKKPIYRFTNRKPPGEWLHEDNMYYCYLDSRHSKDQHATPHKEIPRDS